MSGASKLGGRVLRGLGLERQGRAAELREALAKSEQHVAELKRLLEQSRQEAAKWRAKVQEASTESTDRRKADEEKHRARIEKLESRVREHVDKLRHADTARAAKLDDLRERVVGADRSVRIGRDHLMALEAKLDLIEGAINVLDRRYRTLASTPQSGS
jgi:chromosome segregation ATPase